MPDPLTELRSGVPVALAALLPTEAHRSAWREAGKTEAAGMRLAAEAADRGSDGWGFVKEEVARREAWFTLSDQRCASGLSATPAASPLRRALESVYHDVVTGSA